jgi:putative tryptophan/tyrosine transport system substrate-binding protein
MKRRDAILALLALGITGKEVRAQRPALIAFVDPGPAEGARADNLVEGLRELGHVPGRTFRLDRRVWNGDQRTIQPLLRELLATKPDVLVVGGLQLVQASKQATSVTPIVVAYASDLVSAGVVPSYARPGGNLTGFTTLTDVMTGKRLEILREAVPAARKVMLVQNPAQPQSLAKAVEAHIAKLAPKLGIELAIVNVTDLEELKAALDNLRRNRPDGLLVASHALFRQHSAMLIERAMKQRVFVVHWLTHAAEQGALIVHGVDDVKQLRRAASYVDRILKGAKPGDLPIEQVTSDELIINLKTANLLGLAVSQTILLRANKVIQ